MRSLRGFVVTLLIGQTCFGGGERSNIRGMGMARTFTAAARGLEAVGVNPANITATDGTVFELSLLSSGIHVGSDFLDYGLYTSYFTGSATDSGVVPRYLNSADKRQILDAFTNEIGLATADINTRIVGLRWSAWKTGAIALTINEHLAAMVNLPREYVSFLLLGNPPGSSLQFSGMGVKVAWTREYALTAGFRLPNPSFLRSFNAGVSFKLLQGYGYYELQRFDANLSTSTSGTLFGTIGFLSRLSGTDPVHHLYFSPFKPFPDPAGTGFAVDVGISGAIDDYVSFGMSLTDIGSLLWEKDVSNISVDTTLVVDDPLLASQRDAVEQAVKGKRTVAGPFTSHLPTQFRIGIAVEVSKLPVFPWIHRTLIVAFDYNQGLFDAPGTIVRPRFSLGFEFVPLLWLPLRSGISFGGSDRANVALGFGVIVGDFEIDVATENVTCLFVPHSFSYGSLAAGIHFSL